MTLQEMVTLQYGSLNALAGISFFLTKEVNNGLGYIFCVTS